MSCGISLNGKLKFCPLLSTFCNLFAWSCQFYRFALLRTFAADFYLTFKFEPLSPFEQLDHFFKKPLQAWPIFSFSRQKKSYENIFKTREKLWKYFQNKKKLWKYFQDKRKVSKIFPRQKKSCENIFKTKEKLWNIFMTKEKLRKYFKSKEKLWKYFQN